MASRSPLRGALLGYGFIGSLGHAPAYRDPEAGRVLTAIADASPERRALAQRDFPEARLYADWRELLAREPELDFVDVALPPVGHAPAALAAFARGLHVLCEKPLAWSLEQASEMLAAARTARRVLFPCHNYRHAPVIQAVRAALAEDRIGSVQSLSLATYRNTHAKGVVEWNTDWRRDRKISGGGIAMDHGSHTFYLAFEWLRSYPTAVAARTLNTQATRYDTEDNVFALLQFPNGFASCQLSWTAGMRKVVYALQGTHGGILVDDDRLEIARQRPTSGPAVAQGAITWDVDQGAIASGWMNASHVAWFAPVFADFRQAVEQGDWVSKATLESYRCLEVVDAIYRSAAAGGTEVALKGPPR